MSLSAPLRAVLVGYGKIGGTYANDPWMKLTVPYATHAQVLTDHPRLQWIGVVDTAASAAADAKSTWGVAHAVTAIADLPNRDQIELLVLATPPGQRLEAVERFPALRALIVEKPLGADPEEARALVSVCRDRQILLQVNLTHRADRTMQRLASGELHERIGNVQAAFGTFGNGVRNNGTHWIDLVRLLVAEVESVAVPWPSTAFEEGPLPHDVNVGFELLLTNGVVAQAQPLRFREYRENSLDVWGTRGRLEIVHEGLTTVTYRTAQCRSFAAARELNADAREVETTAYGTALFDLYDDLLMALDRGTSPVSTGENAARTQEVVAQVLAAATAPSIR